MFELVLDNKALTELLENIVDELTRRITFANRTDTLEELLEEMGLQQMMPTPSAFETPKNGKIVVIGKSEIKEDVMLAIAKKLGITNEFEFVLDYYGAEKYPYRKLQYSSTYRLVMFGPIPHSTSGKGDSSSTIAEMESRPDMYPRVVRLCSSNDLKITKTGFKKALWQLIDEGYLQTSA